jgi:hypothetical protein
MILKEFLSHLNKLINEENAYTLIAGLSPPLFQPMFHFKLLQSPVFVTLTVPMSGRDCK